MEHRLLTTNGILTVTEAGTAKKVELKTVSATDIQKRKFIQSKAELEILKAAGPNPAKSELT